MSKGYVYILTNPCLDGWVKIGMTERNDINARIADLNRSTAVPLSFHLYASYETEDAPAAERFIHNIIDKIDCTLRSRETLENGRERIREFYAITPETAYDIFEAIAVFTKTTDKLKREAVSKIQEEEEIIQADRIRRNNRTFRELGIPVGSTLEFDGNSQYACVTLDERNKVQYDGEDYTISALAVRLYNEIYSRNAIARNGFDDFRYQGQKLTEM